MARVKTCGEGMMRLSKKHKDMQHKVPHSKKKKAEKVEYKLDEPIKSNPNESDWQIEKKALKKRHRDHLR